MAGDLVRTQVHEGAPAGLTLDEFLDNFPSVTREQALQVLEFSKNTLMRLSVNEHTAR